MTKVIGKKIARTTFGELKVGDCFFDGCDLFCIKINDSSCLFSDKNTWWELYEDCSASDEVIPVDVEIHIVN